MIFGDVPLEQAEGAILAHSMPALKDGRPHRIAKGTVLTAAHLAELAAAGRDHVVVARLGDDDIEENAAALELAQALVPDAQTQGLRISGAGAGRVNLYATTPGVAVMDVAAINALNAVHPMITLATVPQYHRCDAGGMVATIKIIAYGVPHAALAQAATAGRAAHRAAPLCHGHADRKPGGRCRPVGQGARCDGGAVGAVGHDPDAPRDLRPYNRCAGV